MSPDPLTLAAAEQARNVAVQMMAERGRGLVLVGAARLDLALEHLLKAVMAPSNDPDDKLFTPDRPLGSFGAKISLAARFGLIEVPIEQALHAIRSVRNDFAHSARFALHPEPPSATAVGHGGPEDQGSLALLCPCSGGALLEWRVGGPPWAETA